MIKFINGRVKSFGFAFKGLWTLVKSQPNARIHFLATLAAISLGLYLHISRYDWLFISAAIALVWIMEAFNTALEFLTDLVSPEYNPLAGKAKDCAAAAVLIAAFFALMTGILIFGPKLFHS